MRRVPVGLNLLAFTLVLAPLATANLTAFGIGGTSLLYDSYGLPKFAVAIVGVFAAFFMWSYGWARGRVDGVWASAELWVLLGFTAFSAAATAASADPLLSLIGQSERLEGFASALLYVALFFGGLQLVRSARDLRFLAITAVAAGTILALYGLAQYAGIDYAHNAHEAFGFDPRRAFATFGNPNFLAGYLVLVLPLALGLAGMESRPTVRGVLWSAAALIAGALVVTFTRGAWLAVAVQAVVALAVWRGRKFSFALSWSGLIAPILGGLLVLGLVGISLTRSGETNLVERFTDVSTVTERSMIWSIAADTIAQEPLLGHGPDTFLLAFRVNRSAAYAERYSPVGTMNNAHNWPLQIATTMGVPAALLLFAAIGSVLVRSARILRGNSAAAAKMSVYPAVWLGCLGYVVHMLMNVAVHGATTAFFVLLGALAAPYARQIPHIKRPVVVLAAVSVGVALVAAISGVGALLVGDYAYLASRVAYHAGDSTAAVEQASDAVSIVPFSLKYRRGLAQALSLSWENTVDAAAGSPSLIDAGAERASFDRANAAFGILLERHPADYAGNAWAAALAAAGYNRYGDADLVVLARKRAAAASLLDAHPEAVAALAKGSTDAGAIFAAESVPALP